MNRGVLSLCIEAARRLWGQGWGTLAASVPLALAYVVLTVVSMLVGLPLWVLGFTLMFRYEEELFLALVLILSQVVVLPITGLFAPLGASLMRVFWRREQLGWRSPFVYASQDVRGILGAWFLKSVLIVVLQVPLQTTLLAMAWSNGVALHSQASAAATLVANLICVLPLVWLFDSVVLSGASVSDGLRLSWSFFRREPWWTFKFAVAHSLFGLVGVFLPGLGTVYTAQLTTLGYTAWFGAPEAQVAHR